MNKDPNQEMDLASRLKIHISDSQVQEELDKCKQQYFKQNDLKLLDPAQQVLVSCLKCTICKKIPLLLQECQGCLSIICQQCVIGIKLDVKKTDEERRCPHPECRNKQFEFKMQPFSSKQILKQLDENMVYHSCQREKDLIDGAEIQKEQKISIRDLFQHLVRSCPKRANTCPNCEADFDSLQECSDHLRKDCPFVKIKCNMCDFNLTRVEFMKHPCYDKMAEFRNTVYSLEAKNVELKEEMSKKQQSLKQAQQEREDQLVRLNEEKENEQQEIEELKEQLQQDINTNSQYYRELQKITNIQSMQQLKTPFLMHKYKVNCTTCFDCSYHQLEHDLSNCIENQFSEYLFDNTKRMTEYSHKMGYSGVGKFCSQCARECIYVEQNGDDSISMILQNQPAENSMAEIKAADINSLYFKCENNGCNKILCDQCQEKRVRDFEAKPQLFIQQMSSQRQLQRVYDNLDHFQLEEQKNPDVNVFNMLNREYNFETSLTGLFIRQKLKKGIQSLIKKEDKNDQGLQNISNHLRNKSLDQSTSMPNGSGALATSYTSMNASLTARGGQRAGLTPGYKERLSTSSQRVPYMRQ